MDYPLFLSKDFITKLLSSNKSYVLDHVLFCNENDIFKFNFFVICFTYVYYSSL